MDLRWLLSDRGELYFNTTWADTTAAFDTLHVRAAADVPLSSFPDGLPGEGPDAGPLLYSDVDFTRIHEYSDLETTQLRSTLGATWKLKKYLTVYGSISYFDTRDPDPYLQDTDGSVTLYQTGLNWTF